MSKSKDPEGRRVYPFLAVMKGPNNSPIVHLDSEAISVSAVGLLLVDIARHYARAFQQTGQVRTEDEALEEIRRMFDIEWDNPTKSLEGSIRN